MKFNLKYLVLLLIIPVLLVVGGAVIKSNTDNQSSIQKNRMDIKAPSNVDTISTYVWDVDHISANGHKYLTFCKSRGVNELYLQINPTLEIQQYQSFIEEANKIGIQVLALGGSPYWATSEGHDEFEVFLKWINNYQDESEVIEQFTGVHLDVEPYLAPGCSTLDYSAELTYYQTVIESTLDFCNENNLEFAVSVPFWFNEISYDNTFGKGCIVEWILSKVDTTIIMAYRNNSGGENGILALIKEELECAEKQSSNLIIAVETKESVEYSHVSFYNHDESYMFQELETLINNMQNTKSFKGYAIHYLDTWMDMD